MKLTIRACFISSVLMLTTTLTFADHAEKGGKPEGTAGKPAAEAKKVERKPSEETPRGERKPDGTNRQGQGQPRDGGVRRGEYPEQIKLSEEQQAKLATMRSEFSEKFGALQKKRDAILTDEQKTARTEVDKKMREGKMSRQEFTDALTAALKLTPEQKTKVEAVDAEINALGRERETQRLALLTDAQKAELRKIVAEQGIERAFQFPADVNLTDEQKKGLKALQTEYAAELTTLTEKRDAIMTDERKAAVQAVYKEAQESKKDRQALGAALDAALKLTEAEKSELSETQQKLNELQRSINEKKLALLTPEQKQEFEKKYGSRR